MKEKALVYDALNQWRATRDEEFTKHNLDVHAVYEAGNFENLPTACLMAVCYVDAFASAIAMLEQ